MRWNNLKSLLGYQLLGFALAVGIGVAVYILPLSLSTGALLGIFLFGISFLRLEIPMLVAIFLIPLQSQISEKFYLGEGLNPFNFVLLVILSAWIAQAACPRPGGQTLRGRALRWSPMIFVIGAFWIAVLVGLWRSMHTVGAFFFSAGLNPAKRWITPMLLFFPVAFSSLEKRQIRLLVGAMAVAVLITSLWTLQTFQSLNFDHYSHAARIGGPFGKGGANDLAAFFTYYLPVFLSLALFQRKIWARGLLLALSGVLILTVLFCYSRGAYMGLLASLLFMGAIKARKLLVILLLIALSYKIWLPSSVEERVEMTSQRLFQENERGIVSSPASFESRFEKSTATRLRIWKGALRMLADHPVLGVGFLAFGQFITQYAPINRPMDAHNMYLRVACELGLPGLLVFLCLWGIPFYMAWGLYRQTQEPFSKALALGLMASLVSIIVVNVFGSRFFREELVGLYWILVGIIVRLQILERNDVGEVHQKGH